MPTAEAITRTAAVAAHRNAHSRSAPVTTIVGFLRSASASSPVSRAARSSAMTTTLPVCQPMTTVQNIQLGIALAAIAKQEIAAHWADVACQAVATANYGALRKREGSSRLPTRRGWQSRLMRRAAPA